MRLFGVIPVFILSVFLQDTNGMVAIVSDAAGPFIAGKQYDNGKNIAKFKRVLQGTTITLFIKESPM